MRAPFSRLEPRARWRRLAAVIALMLPVQAALVLVDGALRSPTCTLGIVSFELAGSGARLRAIVQDWQARPPAPLYAAFSLGLDYLFMPLYSTAIALACAIAAGRFRARAPGVASAGALVAYGAWAAAACDAVENAALWQALAGAPADLDARIAFVAASIKFALVGLGIAYALAGVIAAAVASLARARA